MAFEWKTFELMVGGAFTVALAGCLPFYLSSMRRARKLSSYALLDRWPQWDTSEQTQWFAQGRYTGSWLPSIRSRLPRVLPVVGKGFERTGKSRIWLLEEAVVFQREGGKPPFAIPYALIHMVSPAARAIDESSRWAGLSHCMYPAGWPLLLLAFLPHMRVVNLKPRKGARLDHVHITWGRRELPMVSEFQVSTDVATTAEWVVEIERRAKVVRKPGYRVA